MNLTYRPYRDETDLQALRRFVIEANRDLSPLHAWHICDLLWGLYQNTIFDPTKSVGLWEADGELLAFTWSEGPSDVVMQVHPRLRGQGVVEQPILAWAEERARAADSLDDGTLWTKVVEEDTGAVALLERSGFAPDTLHYLLMRRDLSEPLAEPALPEGWALRAVGGPQEWPKRVELHREVWHPSRVTLEAYERLQTVPGYDHDLDLVAVAPDGTLASYCICWLDAENAYGAFEPVGTRAAFRGQGTGKAVMLEGLRRLKRLGARHAFVASVGGNTAATRLYESVGFKTFGIERLYGKPIE